MTYPWDEDVSASCHLGDTYVCVRVFVCVCAFEGNVISIERPRLFVCLSAGVYTHNYVLSVVFEERGGGGLDPK